MTTISECLSGQPKVAEVESPDALQAEAAKAEALKAEAGEPVRGFAWVDRLLRDRAAVAKQIEAGVGLGDLARVMVITILVAGGTFGAAIGAFRGGWQIAFAGLKIPLVLLLTGCVCAPVLTSLRRAVTGKGDLARDLAVLLSSLALASLVQAACVPVFVLALNVGVGYHDLILLAACIYGASGLIGLRVFTAAGRLRPRRGGYLVKSITVVVFLVVAAQMAWVLRPYLVRPRTPQPPLVRELEGNVINAVYTTVRSAAGDYDLDPRHLDELRRVP